MMIETNAFLIKCKVSVSSVCFHEALQKWQRCQMSAPIANRMLSPHYLPPLVSSSTTSTHCNVSPPDKYRRQYPRSHQHLPHDAVTSTCQILQCFVLHLDSGH